MLFIHCTLCRAHDEQVIDMDETQRQKTCTLAGYMIYFPVEGRLFGLHSFALEVRGAALLFL